MIQWDYHTPDAFQDLRMCSDGTVLTGLWFVGSPDEKKHTTTGIRQDLPIFQETIPYGQTTTYGAIAKQIAAKKGIPRMSAQAVGGAVGWNPIGIIVPCHRVIGANGALTGYGGGLQNKIALLKLEGIL